MQDQISELSEELERTDDECRRRGLHSGDRRGECTLARDPRNDCSVRRQALLDELAQRLGKYNEFVLTHSQLKERPAPTKRQVKNVKIWLDNNQSAIKKDEASFIDVKGDLMTLVPKANVPLRRFFNKFECFREIPCFREDMSDADFAPTTIHNKDERIDKAITFTTITIGLVMLLAPLWWLQKVTIDDPTANPNYRLGIITLFIGIFTGLLSLVTVAKPFEVLGATAAYSAVLTIFLQLQAGGGQITATP
ncbi:MAG: hypothetical protein MMC33_007936 [Icmadophila ericetorum]|nr:hypothetical protein [Icmadophila ericetorum]